MTKQNYIHTFLFYLYIYNLSLAIEHFTYSYYKKIVSYGAFQKGGYCREPANILDIVVVSVSIVSIVFSDSAGAVSVLKAFSLSFYQ